MPMTVVLNFSARLCICWNHEPLALSRPGFCIFPPGPKISVGLVTESIRMYLMLFPAISFPIGVLRMSNSMGGIEVGIAAVLYRMSILPPESTSFLPSARTLSLKHLGIVPSRGLGTLALQVGQT